MHGAKPSPHTHMVYHGLSCHRGPSADLACGPTAPSLADMPTPDADEGTPHTQHGRRPEMSVLGVHWYYTSYIHMRRRCPSHLKGCC